MKVKLLSRVQPSATSAEPDSNTLQRIPCLPPWPVSSHPCKVVPGFLEIISCVFPMTAHEFEAKKDNKTPITPGLSGFDGTLAGQPTPVLLPGESHGQRSLVGYIHGVTKSRTRLKP